MITTIIFDLGGVLIDWNPNHLYSKLIADEEQRQHFLTHICSPDWNEEQDAGRPLSEGTQLLVNQFPEHEDNIRAFYDRWEEMLGGPIEGTVETFRQLKESGRYKIYALTNWSAETYDIALKQCPFLSWFDGIVMSGIEKTRKPYPKFYQILLDRYEVKPQECLFIDDNYRNILAAEKMGIQSVHFISSEELIQALNKLEVLV